MNNVLVLYTLMLLYTSFCAGWMVGMFYFKNITYGGSLLGSVGFFILLLIGLIIFLNRLIKIKESNINKSLS